MSTICRSVAFLPVADWRHPDATMMTARHHNGRDQVRGEPASTGGRANLLADCTGLPWARLSKAWAAAIHACFTHFLSAVGPPPRGAASAGIAPTRLSDFAPEDRSPR